MLIARGVKCGTVTGESVSMYGHLTARCCWCGGAVVAHATPTTATAQHSAAHGSDQQKQQQNTLCT